MSARAGTFGQVGSAVEPLAKERHRVPAAGFSEEKGVFDPAEAPRVRAALFVRRLKANQPVPEEMCRLILLRHAAASGNGPFVGQRNVSLSPMGRRQLRVVAQKLSRYRIDAIYSSDLLRARVTAASAAQRLGIKLELREGLREMDFGEWEGLSWRQVRKRFPRHARQWLERFPHSAIPGAEPYADFKRRVQRELQTIAATHKGRCALIVTHAGVIRTFLASVLGMPDRHLFRLAQEPGALNGVDYSRQATLVWCMNG